MNDVKAKVLIFSSSYPWSKNPVYGIFIRDFVYSIRQAVDVILLTPQFPGTPKQDAEQNIKIRRFPQCCPKHMPLAGFPGGILPALKRNPVLLFFLPFFLLSEFLTLGKVIRQEKIDIIHAHWLIPQGVLAALWKKLRGKHLKLILTCHGSDVNKINSGLFAKLKRFALNQADAVVSVSPDMQEKIQMLCPECHCYIQPMGINTELFRPGLPEPDIPRKYGFNGPYVLFVGSLFELKGVRALLEAWPEILQKAGHVHLLFAGDGELRENLQLLTKELQIDDFIHFAGAVPHEELPPYYAQCQAFILPSFSEGFALVVIEALSCNAPVIISELPGLLKYAPLQGLLSTCQAGDPHSIAQAVVQTLNSKNNFKGRDFIQQNLSLESVAEFYQKIYSEK